jgi:hypothetical protein
MVFWKASQAFNKCKNIEQQAPLKSLVLEFALFLFRAVQAGCPQSQLDPKAKQTESIWGLAWNWSCFLCV